VAAILRYPLPDLRYPLSDLDVLEEFAAAAAEDANVAKHEDADDEYDGQKRIRKDISDMGL
jgi:hypothetical protein